MNAKTSERLKSHNFVSGGLNWHKPHCGKCIFLVEDSQYSMSGGWCGHDGNRIYTEDWPQGFTPSVSYYGGCNLHGSK